MLVEERPRWHDNEECKSCSTKSNVQCLVDVLCDEADKESEDARGIEHNDADRFGELLAFEVLHERTLLGHFYEEV